MKGFFSRLGEKLKRKKDTSPLPPDTGTTTIANRSTVGEYQSTKTNTNAYRGRFGEDAAADFLVGQGYEIKGRNLRYGRHELDIIAEDRAYLVFVEVKTRTEAPPNSIYSYGRPASAVTYQKKQNTLAAAREYLWEHPTRKRRRIDVIEVYLARDTDAPTVSRINHIRNAFGAR